MNTLSLESLAAYWSPDEVSANVVIFMNIVGALLLGLVVGYERSYHGRAAGMRTYGLVCMASAALVVVTGYPNYWYGGHAGAVALADPTRVIQGIVAGIGFLGAGVIVKDGLTISGLTSAASIWASSTIGVLVGVGFYTAAILLTCLSAASMMWGTRIAEWLPSHPAVSVSLRFTRNSSPSLDSLRSWTRQWGYEIAEGSLTIAGAGGLAEWRFVATVVDRRVAMSIADLAGEVARIDGVEDFRLSFSRS
ncbi:MgtC/SapB family protein [Accumulibacter sp.]|uniref:MgtC/SapB family protein n=1 Tax=Accumulibacter sp. TaxID=2053492 RepID=UPI0025FE2B61|nr:MgtC/SapB family protein [Accumulibacter sp.]MCM8596313.1 MgtC/SapB family protein [Accumulibacter sp.]MCM8627447.1 MgtC/SapB family protein [Accumulibacter sp.]MDS4050462.1 MgtC/SapB family protein [Accumulibacter sp.]